MSPLPRRPRYRSLHPRSLHPMWLRQRSRLAPLVHDARAYDQLVGRAAVAIATCLIGMMLLRVVIAWSQGRLG
ncbi:hypothetical protein [Sphingomonas sp. BE137]|uniref:hypothetical protein n=1 Tax=Sphingomonas sp. BE137 TaxID=2817844 RepID=UPI001AE87160|nr:hypothetical protein [Sphingomonas sp. BE137]MDR6847152.1 hypothetical protein [Sphingomonas sp. BE137]